MQNKSLVIDYLNRAEDRLAALEVFVARKSWANLVRESQEVVELVLKALLRFCGVEVPRIHDVSAILNAESGRLPKEVLPHLKHLIEISKSLRRDRELAFYGSEDLTPTDFYSEADALAALSGAQETFRIVRASVGEKGPSRTPKDLS